MVEGQKARAKDTIVKPYSKIGFRNVRKVFSVGWNLEGYRGDRGQCTDKLIVRSKRMACTNFR